MGGVVVLVPHEDISQTNKIKIENLDIMITFYRWFRHTKKMEVQSAWT